MLNHRSSARILMKALVLASALAIAQQASASTFTFTPNVQISTPYGWMIGPEAGVTWDRHPWLTTAFEGIGIALQAIPPGSVTQTTRTNSVTTPMTSLTVYDSPSHVATVTDVYTQGGVLLTATANDYATTGGTLAITNLHIDVAHKQIYADLTGSFDHAMPTTLGHVAVWSASGISGATAFDPSRFYGYLSQCTYKPVCITADMVSFKLTNLAITADAFTLFSHALGLTEGGADLLKFIPDFGTVSVRAVPETSSALMMAIGLLGMMGATRMRRATSSQ